MIIDDPSIQPIHHEEKRQFDIMFARSSIGYVFKKTRGKDKNNFDKVC